MSEHCAQFLARIPLPEGLDRDQEYQVVITLERRRSGAVGIPAQPEIEACQEGIGRRTFNVQFGSRRQEVLHNLLTRYRVRRYQLLDLVLEHVQVKENASAFRQFLQKYQEPRLLSGGQVHFDISPQSQFFLHEMSWEFVQGNRSAVARAAIEFVCR